ncbi:DUF1573 domain-containing protein [uncultured Tenacibaculum sp.]|uniref:DUF1573 domain-containing protein n=1 Tax=uncultured Tenacibaculum sp. TaxID=174713 RepID=UPI00262F9DFF|nr:DUF1573 domain-containing protein [uncultured Tenacibaculum sp.]
MRTIITFLVAVFTIGMVNAQEFKFEKETIDYGKVVQGTEGKRVFEFTNIGEEPLIIKQVISTCGCAVSKTPTQPIMPGKKGKIEVSYDTKRIGGFSKMFTVMSNAKAKRKALKIKGFVEKSLVAAN